MLLEDVHRKILGVILFVDSLGIDQNVYMFDVGLQPRDQRLDALLVAGIDGVMVYVVAAFRLDFGDGAFQRSGISAGDRNPCARFREPLRYGLSDAAGTADHHGIFSIQ